MVRAFRLAVVTIALATTAGVALAQGRPRHALLIPNENYPGQLKLRTPFQDAVEIQSALEQRGYRVVMAANRRTKGELESSVRDWVKSLPQNSIALLYYSGHGFEIDGRSYLLPVNAKARYESEAILEAVDLQSLLEDVTVRPGIVPFVIIDACRDGWPKASTERWKSAPKALSPSVRDSRAAVLFSTGAGASAADGLDELTSTFGRSVSQAFRGGHRTIAEVTDYVIQQVGSVTPDQRPVLVSSMAGSTVISGNSTETSTQSDNRSGIAGRRPETTTIATGPRAKADDALLVIANTVRAPTEPHSAPRGPAFRYTAGRFRYRVREKQELNVSISAGTFGMGRGQSARQAMTIDTFLDVEIAEQSQDRLLVRVRLDSSIANGKRASVEAFGSIVETEMDLAGRLGQSRYTTTGGDDVKRLLWSFRSVFPMVSGVLAVDNEWTDTVTYDSRLGRRTASTLNFQVKSLEMSSGVTLYTIRQSASVLDDLVERTKSYNVRMVGGGEFLVSELGQLLRLSYSAEGPVTGRDYLGKRMTGTMRASTEVTVTERLR